MLHLTLRLTPHGHLVVESDAEAPPLEPARGERIERAFARGTGHGLLLLGGAEVGTVLPPVFGYWRAFAARFVTAVCTAARVVAPPEDLAALGAPLMPGAEYLTAEVLAALWQELGAAFSEERGQSSVEDFLRGLHPAWNVVGRVHFNLAENRRDQEAPFAFLATYTGRVSAQGKAQHQPLGQALRESTAEKERLLSLLVPVQRAAERCAWLREMIDAGEIFHPLRFTPEDAMRMLGDVQALEQAGVIVRMPATWRAGRPPRPRVTATVGARPPAGVGGEALLDFRTEVLLDGEPLSADELELLLASSGLAFLRGRWVEVDRERLTRTMEHFRAAERLAARGGLGFAEAMRLVAGADMEAAPAERPDVDWSQVVAGPWLARLLEGLRAPESLAKVAPGLRGTLRPYQEIGVRWLQLVTGLGLGACLADDMGLGKTIQVLALLLLARSDRPSVLVAPASLLGNWTAEIERFAPRLRALVAHPSALPAAELAAPSLDGVDLVVTSYGQLLRLPWLQETAWDLAILDEAQAIKNPGAKQTRAAKQLRARARIALTGTPVENRLGDLWSIFDYTNPGLLGSGKQFTAYTRQLADSGRANPYGPLRELVRPYILRRLKTDRAVISDLPDKTEVKAFCLLGRKQAALYQRAVDELAAGLRGRAGIERRGMVLSFLMRFKQICNHPSHWLGDGAWDEADSGKLARLREIAEVVAARQEKVLVFTQFREVTGPIAAFLGDVFGRPGLVLHGGTEVRKRKALVDRFQEDESVPFFVLSLKAGGSGLNLTAASHVIHFDRWWNPAVENQATDRAFRIGQQKNVLVHKFVCRGTVEDKIDQMIESKQKLATELLEGGSELDLTSLADDDLLRLVRLDLPSAMKE